MIYNLIDFGNEKNKETHKYILRLNNMIIIDLLVYSSHY
jgi:hypothetical protein